MSEKTTSEDIYEFLILKVLIESGGSAEPHHIKKRIFQIWGNKMTPEDLEEYAHSKKIRWETLVHWERDHLKRKGHLRSNSPHGVWEITESGRGRHQELVDYLRHELGSVNR